MEPLPKRTSRISETAATLKEWIRAGILQDVLPGEFVLKERLGVGRDTIRLALKLLTDEGWITPSLKGQRRHLNANLPPPADGGPQDKLPVTFLSPNAVETRVTLMEMEDTRARLAQLGHNLRYLSPNIFHLKHPEHHLENLVRSNPSAAWVLFLATEPMQRWFDQKGIPTFLYCTPFPGVTVPYVVSDWEAAAFHAGIQLVRQGHKIVGNLEYRDPLPGLVRNAKGLERALATGGKDARLVSLKDNRTPASVVRCLKLAFGLKERPTALVLTNTSQLITCFSWMVSRGIRVPDDLSLVSMVHDSWFSDLLPPISHYQPNTKLTSRAIADRVLELVETRHVTGKSLEIPLDYVPGASIGPVPRGKRLGRFFTAKES